MDEFDRSQLLARCEVAIKKSGKERVEALRSAGIAESTLRNWKTSVPTLVNVFKLARVLDVRPGWLAYGEGPVDSNGEDEDQAGKPVRAKYIGPDRLEVTIRKTVDLSTFLQLCDLLDIEFRPAPPREGTE